MVTNTEGCGQKESLMDMEFLLGETEENIKVIFEMVRKKVKEQ